MPRTRTAAFIAIYGLIIFLMLFVHFYVQKHYSTDPSSPYKRRIFDKFFIQKESVWEIKKVSLPPGFKRAAVLPVPFDRTA